MQSNSSAARPIIVGQPALLLFGILPADAGALASNPILPGCQHLATVAREVGIPVIRFEERGGLKTDTHLNPPETGIEPVHGSAGSDYVLPQWRHSGFKGTELEILLKGLKVETLILAGRQTDVALHYTFVDGHQHDYFVRVAEDCSQGSSLEAQNYALSAMEYLQHGARRSGQELIEAMRALVSHQEA